MIFKYVHMVYIGKIWYITVSNEFKKYHEVNHRWWIMTIWFHTVDFAWLCIVGDDTWVFGGLLWVQMDYWMYQRSPPTVPPMLHTFLWTNCMMIFNYIYIYLSLFDSQMYQRGFPPCTPWASYISGTHSARTFWESRHRWLMPEGLLCTQVQWYCNGMQWSW